MAGVKRPRAMLDLSDRLLEGRYSEPPAIRRAVDSSDGKTRTPSPTLTPLTGEIPSFGPNASVVFVGIRGTGKSTLAIMASSAMKRKVLDLETAFQRSSGMSSASYKSIHGSAQCHHQQAKILQGVLDRNRSDAVIVCSWMESRVQELLRHFAATNPVIHVVRDAEAIQEHLKVRDAKKMENLINVSKVIFRSCANFELFNVSERPRDTSAPASPNAVFQRLPAPYLTLKQAERHLLKFLSLIYPPGAIPFIESAFPLANMATEDRRFTYALSLPLRELKSANFDLEEHVTGADAIQIHVEGLDSQSDEKSADLFMSLASDITRGVGMVRRAAILPIAVHVELPENMTDSVVRLYTDLVSHALRLAPEMITLDLRLQDTVISQFVADNGRSRIVANRIFTTSEAPSWESSTWTSLYRRACQLGCDMVRLVRPALSIDDNFAINSFKQAVKSLDCIHIPLISYNSGSIGRHSAVFNQILTPVKSISWPSPELDTSPLPCISALDATKALCSSFIYDPMRLYVFGVQVDYSMSPAMHNSALRACGLHFQYEPHSTDSLNGIRHMIEDPLFGGASIGLPFKVEVITLTMEMSRHAKAIGAVNTLIPLRNLSEDGSLPPSSKFYSNIGRAGPVRALYGDNTDWIGIKQCIRRGLSPANAVKPATCGVVIGAGGMSRAAVGGLSTISGSLFTRC
jgi:shikimate kinase